MTSGAFECTWRLLNRGWHLRIWGRDFCEGHFVLFALALWRGSVQPWRTWQLLWDDCCHPGGLQLRMTHNGKQSGWMLQGPRERRACPTRLSDISRTVDRVCGCPEGHPCCTH